MKKLINAPDAVVRESLEGVAAAHADRVRISLDPLRGPHRRAGPGQAGDRLRRGFEEHGVAIVLDEGFIWKRGDCGQGTFDVEAEGIHLSFEDSNWTSTSGTGVSDHGPTRAHRPELSPANRDLSPSGERVRRT